MFRSRTLLITALLLAGTACTQKQQAQVDLKGHQNFGRNATSSVASYAPPAELHPSSYTTPAHAELAPASGDTVATASISSIGVQDIPAPTKQTAAQTTAAVAKSQPANLAPAAGKPAQNPWTGKPREVKLINSSEPEAATEPTYAKPAPLQASSGYIWPVSSKKVMSTFGPKGKGKVNDGINIASTNGEPVWAAADGEVVYSGSDLEGYGKMVLIKHQSEKTTTYAHLGRIVVDKYERVKQGDIIGYVGASGKVKEPQLHFAVREGNNPVDPVKFMKRNMVSQR